MLQTCTKKPVYSPFFLYVTIVFCHNRKRDERQIALSSLFCYDRKKNFTSSWPLPPRRRQRRSCRPSGCCQRRGSPSSRRAPGQKSCPRTARRSAYDPWCRSCRKKQRHSIPVSICKLLLINAIIAMGKLLVSK